jgi:hypothetical protein
MNYRKLRSWDAFWEDTKHITRIQYDQDQRAEEHQRLIDEISHITNTGRGLTGEQIESLAEIIRHAYAVGRSTQ